MTFYMRLRDTLSYLLIVSIPFREFPEIEYLNTTASGAISRKRLFQRTTNTKWPMGYQMAA